MHETEQIYQWLKMAKSLVITAGAGIGVDSGLSDYRGSGGQWGKVETENEKSVFDVVNPKLFLENPEYGWKLFASRLVEYTNATPHEGFKIILDLIDKFSLDYFVLTSNVDNQFQKAGFDQSRIRELHGCVFYLQCSLPCSDKIWEHQLDLNTIQAEIVNGKFPTCPVCGNISRPNVYMFRDNTFLPHRTNNQELKFLEFLEKNKNDEMLVFEIGSGPHVQSIRKKTRMLGLNYNAKIVRINPKDAKIKKPHIGLEKGALEALKEIEQFIVSEK